MAIWSTPGGSAGNGITGKAGSKPRVHATADDWGSGSQITDFWFWPNADILTASSPHLLSAIGWITNGSVSVTAGSGADFLGGDPSNVDFGVPSHFLVNTSGERLTSPFIFGSYEARYFINRYLGWNPKILVAETVCIWTTSSNADTTGGIGFVEAGGAIQTAADHLAMVTSDATNFILRSGAATSTSAKAVDTNRHLVKIVLGLTDSTGAQVAQAYVDGTSIGSIALETDLYPAAFGVATTSSNVIGMGPTHIYYD